MASSINASTAGAGGVITTADSSGILNLQSGGNTIATVQSTGFSLPTASTINAANTFEFKNRLINGDMRIWQRGTSFTGGGSLLYYADRWSGVQYSGSTSTITQVTTGGLAGATYAMQSQRPNGATNTATINVGQSTESQNVVDLAGQTVTLSFWARAGAGFSATSNILNSGIYTGTGTDQNIYTGYTGAVSTVQNNTLTTSWQKFTQTTTIASNATEVGVAIYYTPTGTAGASDYFQFTLVQLELGSQATSFDFRDIGRELILCQRYFQTYSPPPLRGVVSTALQPGRMAMVLPVVMRTSPTATLVSGVPIYDGGATGTGGTLTASFCGPVTCELDITLTAGGPLTVGRAAVVYQGSGQITLGAEI